MVSERDLFLNTWGRLLIGICYVQPVNLIPMITMFNFYRSPFSTKCSRYSQGGFDFGNSNIRTVTFLGGIKIYYIL